MNYSRADCLFEMSNQLFSFVCELLNRDTVTYEHDILPIQLNAEFYIDLIDMQSIGIFKIEEGVPQSDVGSQRQIDDCQDSLETIPNMYGSWDVSDVEAAYKIEKRALEEVRRRQDEWDGKLRKSDSRKTERSRRSIRECLQKSRWR